MSGHVSYQGHDSLNVPADEWFPCCAVDASHYRANEPRSKAPFVQTAADEMCECLRRDVPLFAQPVHVDFVSEEFTDSADIGCETCETEIYARAVWEDLWEVVRHRESL